MRLLMVRHGQTPHNVNGALDTAFPGADVTPLGQAQARALPRALTEYDISAIYASRLVRTQMTAEPLGRALGLDVQVRSGLEEISAGELELRTDADAVQAFATCVAAWLTGEPERRMPGGTTGREFFDRYDGAVRAIADEHRDDETIAIFSHGAAIRVFTSLTVRLEPEIAIGLRIMNTGMGVLEGHPDTGWRLVDWLSEPLGGLELEDFQAHDVTGESPEDVVHES